MEETLAHEVQLFRAPVSRSPETVAPAARHTTSSVLSPQPVPVAAPHDLRPHPLHRVRKGPSRALRPALMHAVGSGRAVLLWQ